MAVNYITARRGDRSMDRLWQRYDALAAAIAEGGIDLGERIQSAPEEIFGVCGPREDPQRKSLIWHLFDSDLPVERKIALTRLLLLRAPYLALIDHIGHVGEPPARESLMVAALERDEGLAIQLAEVARTVSFTAILKALKHERTQFLRTTLPKLELKWLAYLYNHATPQQREMLLEEIDERLPPSLMPDADEFLVTLVQQSEFRPVLQDFTRRVLLPAAMRLRHERTPVEHMPPPLKGLEGGLNTAFAHFLVGQMQERGLRPSEMIGELRQLALPWNHSAIQFPPLPNPPGRDLPQYFEYEWYPLTHAPYIARNGLEIHELTNSAELRAESDALNHCAKSYNDTCSSKNIEERTHLFSVRDAQGNRLSTLQLDYRNMGEVTNPLDVIQRKALVFSQHESRKVQGIRQPVKSGPMHEAVEEFLDGIRSGAVPIKRAGNFGQTSESIARNNRYHPLIRTCGYYPSWENIERAFQDFKREARRGAARIDEQERIVYRDEVSDDGYRHSNHLIDGKVASKGADGKVAQFCLRDMSLCEWLNTTQILASPHIHPEYRKLFNEPLSATQPPPLLPRQSQQAQRRIAARIQSGTLNEGEKRHLTRSEQRHYEGRLSEQKRAADSAYFARST